MPIDVSLAHPGSHSCLRSAPGERSVSVIFDGGLIHKQSERKYRDSWFSNSHKRHMARTWCGKCSCPRGADWAITGTHHCVDVSCVDTFTDKTLANKNALITHTGNLP
jgi:hypothetical protein